MRVFKSFVLFAETTGVITCPETLSAYNLITTSAIGVFLQCQYKDLLDFCQKNPDFHIVSCQRSAFVNKPSETASYYFLAMGDPDPRIYCVRPTSEIRHLP